MDDWVDHLFMAAGCIAIVIALTFASFLIYTHRVLRHYPPGSEVRTTIWRQLMDEDFPIAGMEEHTDAPYWHAYERKLIDNEWEFALAPTNVDVAPDKADGWTHVKTFDHMPSKEELIAVEERHGLWSVTDKGKALLKVVAAGGATDIASWSEGWDACEQYYAAQGLGKAEDWLESIFKNTDEDADE